MSTDADDLTPAMQRYLMAIVDVRRDASVTTGEIARELGCSPPSVSEMLHRLEEAGHLVRHGALRRGGWRLTTRGWSQVAAIRRRQSVLELFLRSCLRMDAAEAVHEAAQLGPSVSRALERRLCDAVWPVGRPCGATAGTGDDPTAVLVGRFATQTDRSASPSLPTLGT